MKTLPLTLAGVLTLGFLAAAAGAQPILDRVEQQLRDQVDSAATPPAAVEPGYLGLIGDNTSDAAGVRVLQVLAGQPASAAGVRAGDLITKIDERPIRAMDDVARALEGKSPGTKLAMVVARQGAEQQLEVTLGRRPGAALAANEELPPPPQPSNQPEQRLRLGVRTVPVSETVRRQNNLPAAAGAQVVSVTVGSPAEQAKIPLGAVVTAVDGAPVNTPNELAAAIGAAGGPEVELSYVHRGQAVRQKVALAGAIVAGQPPQREVRARPPVAEFPAPADVEAAEKPPAAGEQPQDPIATLERRIAMLEARIKTLEAELGRLNPKPDAEGN
jgi:S1-C subfamily serine protease